MPVVFAILSGFILGRIYEEVRSRRRRVALKHFIRAYHV